MFSFSFWVLLGVVFVVGMLIGVIAGAIIVKQ